MVEKRLRFGLPSLGPLEELEIYLELCCTLPEKRDIQMFGRPTRNKYAGPKKPPKKTTAGKGHKSSGSSNQYCLMPGYTGHVPGMMSMDAGLSYVQKTGQYLDKVERPDRIHHTVKISEPLDILSSKGLFTKELTRSKSQKSKSTSTKSQKPQVSTKHKSKGQKPCNSQQEGSHKDAQAAISLTAKSPSLKQSAASQHMSPVPGYTGHIPGQLTMWPGVPFGQQVSAAQNGLWNPGDSVPKPLSPNHDPSYTKRPSGYTGHLPGAIHLEPGLSYRKVTKAIQHHMSPSDTPSRSSTSENPRGKGKVITQMGHSEFFNTVPSGYCGHIPGMMQLEPGQTYTQQNVHLSGSKKHSQNPVVSAHVNNDNHRQYPSGYGGHIPGAQLLEPGLSHCQQTKLLEERLQAAAGQKTKNTGSRPPSKPSSKASVRSQTSKQSMRSNQSSKASTREPTANKSKLVTGQPNGTVYTSKGNVPGYTGHVPSPSDYHGLSFGEMTKDFGKSHQSREPDELVKGLRVRMPW